MRPAQRLAVLLSALALALGGTVLPSAAGGPDLPGSAAASGSIDAEISAEPDAGDLAFRLVRVAGSDRYGTAAALSARLFSPGVPVAYVAAGTTFPDALSAGPAADQQGGPVLFVRPTSLPSATATELSRLRPARIVVVGGTSAVSASVLTSLRAYTTGSVTRVSGPTRYDTSVAVSRAAFPSGAPVVWVATGRDWPDALSAGAAAAVQGGPVLLTDPASLPVAVRTEIARLAPARILVVGGTGAVSANVQQQLATIAPTERVSGSDRYATSAAIAQRAFGPARPGVAVATGTSFPDALAAVPATLVTRGPVLLSRSTALPAAISTQLDLLSPRTAYLLGGTGSLSIDVARGVQRVRGVCWAGPTYPSTESQKVLTTVGGTTSKKVAFTLDMGGRLDGATQIVDYLIANQVCTTFFPTSIMADSTAGRALMAKIAANPHLFEVGNHTVHHCDLVAGGGGSPSGAPCARTMTDAFVRSELTGATPVLQRLSGMPVTPMWRPPYGSHDARVRSLAAQAGYPVSVMWTRDTIDWDPNTSTAQIVARTTSPLPPSGAIVLAHLGGYNTPAALPQIVTILRNNGYTMTTVSDMRDG